jgi:hypothetical protein
VGLRGAPHSGTRHERERVTREALTQLFADQQFDVVTARRVLGDRWDRLLADLMFDLNLTTASAVADLVAADLGVEFNPAQMAGWFRQDADRSAVQVNDSTRDSLSKAVDDVAKVAVFEALMTAGAQRYARSMVTASWSFGAHDVAVTADGATKTWHWSGRGSRHREMAGQTVPVGDRFSNGMKWPGDPSGGAENVANCRCQLVISGGDGV